MSTDMNERAGLSTDLIHSSEPPALPSPLRLAVPQNKPIAVWVILAVNILVWLVLVSFSVLLALAEIAPQTTGDWAAAIQYALALSTDARMLISFGAKYNPLIIQGQVWRLITPVFLHVGLVHLLFNSYAIYVIAPQIERFFGTVRFLCIYLFSGAFGVLLSFVFNPSVSAGASGAIFGLFGTQVVFFYRYRQSFGSRGQRQFQNTLSIIIFNLVMTFAVAGIDIWGHIGGLLTGIALGWCVMPRYVPIMASDGPMLVDARTSRQWSVAALGMAALLAVGAWVAIVIKK